MNAQRNGLAQRQAETVRRQALLVDPVPRLVQDAEEGCVEEPLVVTRGDAAVVRPERRAKGMGRHVKPPSGEVEADRRGRFLAERLLHVDRVVAAHERGVRLAAGSANGRNQRNELFPEIGQHASDIGRQFLRLIIVQQGVVGRLPVAQRLGLLPLEFECLGQPGPKLGKVILPPGLLPGALAQDGGPGKLLDQAPRQFGLLVDQPLQPPDRDGRFALRPCCQGIGG